MEKRLLAVAFAIAAIAAPVGRAHTNDEPPPDGAPPQGDLAVGLAGSSQLVGTGVHGEGANGQTLRDRRVVGGVARFRVQLRNDGEAPGVFGIRAPRWGAGFAASYLEKGTDVTRAVAAGTFATAELQPGEAESLAAVVRVRSGVPPDGAVLQITETPAAADLPRDAVRIVIRIARPGPYGYGWPVQPFFRQHPVRGSFGDPRIWEPSYSFHFGIDIPGAGGTLVYPVRSGTVLHVNGHIEVASGFERFFYWHLVPHVHAGQYVVAYRTPLGHMAAHHAHVHFAEFLGGHAISPLRPGGIGPYADPTRPFVGAVRVVRGGQAVEGPVHGTVGLEVLAFDEPPIQPPGPYADPTRPFVGAVRVVRGGHAVEGLVHGTVGLEVLAFDEPPIQPPGPFDGAVFTPALVRWRLLGPRGHPRIRWRSVFDVRHRLPTVAFDEILAPGSDQNRPNRPGTYLFWLDRAWRSSVLPDGAYTVQVEAVDAAGNVGRGSSELILDNR